MEELIEIHHFSCYSVGVKKGSIKDLDDRTEKEMLKLKIQSQIDKLQKMKNELD